MRIRRSHAVMLSLSLALLVPIVAGCGGDGTSGKKRQYITLGTATSGGVFKVVGDQLAELLNEHKGDNKWKVQAKGTNGSQQNIRMLDKEEVQLAMSNSAISHFAYEGEGVWDKKYDIRAVVTIAPNIGVFVTKSDSGIEKISDLKGKKVSVGPPGAGFDMFLGPLMSAHGVKYTADDKDFTPVNVGYADSISLLGDGDVDACFLGGAIPTPIVTQASTTLDLRFLTYDEDARNKLLDEFAFYQDMTVPAKNKDGKPTYKGLNEDLPALNVGSMHVITRADMDEDVVYELTKTIWENRKSIKHKAGNAINEKNAARFTGVPFHPGAIRFYKEIEIWSDDDADADDE